MHWAVRKQRKEILKNALSISISVDDRKDFRLVRYRCSLNPEAQGSGLRAPADSMQEHALAGLLPDVGPGGLSLEDWSKIDPFVYDGLLGVYRLGGDVAENTLESHDHDKSDSMAKSILEVIRRACLDPDGDLDQESFAMIQSKVQHFASDQGPSAISVARSRHQSCQPFCGSPMMLPIKSEMLSKIHSMLYRNLASSGSACLGDAMLSYQTSKTQKFGRVASWQHSAQFWIHMGNRVLG